MHLSPKEQTGFLIIMGLDTRNSGPSAKHAAHTA
jgi:hypothetical protein